MGGKKVANKFYIKNNAKVKILSINIIYSKNLKVLKIIFYNLKIQ